MARTTDYYRGWLTWLAGLGLDRGEISAMAAEALNGPVRPGYERVRAAFRAAGFTRRCQHCGTRFVLDGRLDRLYCRPACRTLAYDARTGHVPPWKRPEPPRERARVISWWS